MHALVEEPHDRPALGHVVQLAEGAQVAEERGGLVGRLEAEDRLEQLGRCLVAPGFHRAHGRFPLLSGVHRPVVV